MRHRATAVDDDDHLTRCLTYIYIDLNMVRAGVGANPAEWDVSGYREHQGTLTRYMIMDREELASLVVMAELGEIAQAQPLWGEEAHSIANQNRDPAWTASIAIGSEAFVRSIRSQLGGRARYRTLSKIGTAYCLRESIESYN